VSASRAPAVVRARRTVEAELQLSLSEQQYVDTVVKEAAGLPLSAVHDDTHERSTKVDNTPEELTVFICFYTANMTKCHY
jgi:hypothetical protein